MAHQGSSEEVGERISQELVDLKKLGVDLTKCLLILLSDGTNTDGEALIGRISESCQEISVAGGMASARTPNLPTAVCFNGLLITEGAVGILLCDENLKVFQGYLFDWEEVGDYHLITKSEKNRVYTVDGIPAVEFYGRILGKEIENSLPDVGINYPLVYRKKGIKIARACIKRFPDNSLGFAGHLPEGTKVRLSTGTLRGFTSRDRDIRVLKAVARRSEKVFIFSCIARKNFLQDLAEVELALFMNVPNVGFFTHGEFFKRANEEGLLLNETLTVAGVSTEERRNRVPHIDEELLYPYKKSEIFKTYHPIFHLLKRTGNKLEVVETGLSHTKSCIMIFERAPNNRWFCSFVSENSNEILGVDHVSVKSMEVNADYVLNNLVYPKDRRLILSAIDEVKRFGETQVDFRIVVEDKIKWIRGFVKLIKQEDLEILTHTFQDITSEKQVEFLANFDPLTKLFNRRILKEVNKELRVSKAWNAVLFIDIDKFKEINDTYGHEVGDKVLNFVAKVMRESIRKSDVAVRYAGDEFLIILKDVGRNREEAVERAKMVAERILKRVKEEEVFPFSVSISIGVKVFQNTESLNRAITEADKIMYLAKKKGGNRYEIAS